jgi:glycosyltransferase involved in cell wall biosynthesis
MRFLILSQYFPPEVGAAQARLGAFAKELHELGHTVEVATSLPNYPVGKTFPGYEGRTYVRELADGIPVHRVWTHASMGGGMHRLMNYGSFAAMAPIAMCKSKRPDYLFVESPPLSTSLPAFLWSKVWKTPVIFNVSDLWPDSVVELGIMKDGWTVRRARDLERWCYRNATYVCAVTEGIRDALIEKSLPPRKILYMPNGIDAETFRPLPPNEKLRRKLGMIGKQLVMFVGTHSYASNAESLLHAADILRADNTIHFLFVGSGSAKRDLMALAKSLQLPNVTFLDAVPPSEVPQYFSIALCGVCTLGDNPLLYTARPAKALPVMACAKPLVFAMGDKGAHPIEEARAGIRVSIHKPEEIADAIKLLARSPDLARRLGENGRSYVVAHLMWRKLVADFLRQLREGEAQPEEHATVAA